MPSVDGVVELDARIGTGPGGMANLFPQIARLDGLGCLAIGAADQCPVCIVLDGLQESVGYANGVVGILAGLLRTSLSIRAVFRNRFSGALT
jgi:hypothetical protein